MDSVKPDRPPSPVADAAGLHLVTTRSEQENLRVLEQIRAIRSQSADPGAELGVVRASIGLKLRLLEKEVDKHEGLTQDRLDRWRRRQRISGSVTITTTQYSTSTGKAYAITATCQSAETDLECPRFPPFEDDYLPENLAEGRRAAREHRDNWVLGVLSELDAELGMELARVGRIEDEYGHQDPERRQNAERQRRVAGAAPPRVVARSVDAPADQ